MRFRQSLSSIKLVSDYLLKLLQLSKGTRLSTLSKQEDRKYQLALYWSFTPSTCEMRCKWSVIVEESPMSLSVAKMAYDTARMDFNFFLHARKECI